MGMFDTISFSPPNFNMGDDRGAMLKAFLRRKDMERMREEQQQQFQAGLPNLRKQQEMANVAKVMAPEPAPATQNVKFPNYNPGLDEFRRNQTELGRDKLALAKEKQQQQASLADRNLGVKERLASLRDMPDSEKARLLQEGRITLQEIRDAEAMKRLEVSGQQRTEQIDQAGNIRTGQINLQNDAAMNRVVKQGEIGSRYITERAKAASATPPSSTQQAVATRSRAVQLINQNPQLAPFITFNEQGSPIISPDAPMEAQMEIYRSLYGTSATTPIGAGGDVNLPAGQPSVPNAQPVTQPAQPTQPAAARPTVPFLPTDKHNVFQKTGMFGPNSQEQAQPQKSGVMKQYSPSRNQTRISTDGGKTWKIVEGKQ